MQKDPSESNLKLLTIFQFIYTGFCGLGILFLIFHYRMMSYFMTQEELWTGEEQMPFDPAEFFDMFQGFYILFGIMLAVGIAMNLASAIFMMQRRFRLYSVILGGLNCLWIPFGTLIGIFTIILLEKDGIKELYNSEIDFEPPEG